MRAIRTLLTVFLLVAAPLLSFDALLHAAEADGLIRGPLTILGHWTLSAHTLAGIWALVIEALIWVGVVGLRVDSRDWRAWLAFALGLVLSLGFQAAQLDTWLARFEATVPPLATAIAIVIFEWPRQRQARPERASGPPAPARLHAWLRSWDAVAPAPAAQPTGSPTDDTGGASVPARPRQSARRATAGPISDTDRARVAAWLDEDPPRSARWIAGQLGLSNHARSKHLAPLIEELRASPVGGPGPNGDGP